MTGTDEHGLKIQQAAKAKGLEPQAFCDELSQHFRGLAAKANISHTRFSRTTEKEHYEAVQHLWRGLDAKGLIYKGKHEGWYSVTDECFYTDGQVTKVVSSNPEEDQFHISVETGSKVEWTQEENYKFRLSVFRESLLNHYQQHPDAVYPEQFHADVVATLSVPVEDLSVSRPRSRLSWGIPVPNDPEHTIYVWIDALTVYLSATGYPWKSDLTSLPEAIWPPNVQIIGKDILRFHAIYLPAMLQALGLPLSRQLLTHSHWTVGQRKMSKSVGNVADPFEAIDEFGPDVVRYYLARVGGRFKDDVDWSHSQLEKHFRELMSLLGNTYMRITSKKIMEKVRVVSVEQTVEPFSEHMRTIYNRLLPGDSSIASAVDQEMSRLKIADALEHIMNLLGQANELMTLTEPWAKDTGLHHTIGVQTIVLHTLRVCGILLQPFIPSKAEELLDALFIPVSHRTLAYANLGEGRVGGVTPGLRLFNAPRSGEKAHGTKGRPVE
ncbi:uncharacterized protein PHACADRAFT_192397 [Phanerochaete carnosa HHB-10118-sp]|uniref:Probable methionine--tRNA ligase, mitochondrial n=1 Tax=Phanerochaete carnosa (strain HHB-10118-sp) TaxID=650164 RepID=K5W7S3_PHACS|nr:uncharacterized protein PHACADRAFT_192397 [Phanerochaete carnosa HHB-10118-sp]EKM59998.1 hypothetical protein PHACADRAFT_192397 [Phanerochaete carnosa HHB-10118-sp]